MSKKTSLSDSERQALREIHDALDALELYLKARRGPGGADASPAVDLVVQLRRKIIQLFEASQDAEEEPEGGVAGPGQA